MTCPMLNYACLDINMNNAFHCRYSKDNLICCGTTEPQKRAVYCIIIVEDLCSLTKMSTTTCIIMKTVLLTTC